MMLVLVRGDPAFTKTEVIGLDILAPRHPKLYSLIVSRLGYEINSTTNVVSNSRGQVDDSCQPDASGRQICLKPFMYPTDVVNILLETGGFGLSATTCQGNSIIVWSLSK
jgi:hypothetical protein